MSDYLPNGQHCRMLLSSCPCTGGYAKRAFLHDSQKKPVPGGTGIRKKY